MAQVVLFGNEAVARGAWEAGARVGVGYPGTPSTETLESFATLEGVYAEWAPNEKVALEVAAGVSLGGWRSLVTTKHVGLNVAADPLFTLAYTGVRGGIVILVADDPGMHSSQDEQDSRNYAAFARVPMLEPSDGREAYEFTKWAFEISERYDTPVLVRSTTRMSHSKSLVDVGERTAPPEGRYESDVPKYVMMPAMARVRRKALDERLAKLQRFSDECDMNVAEMRDTSLGVIASGIPYQYVREALPNASVLKIGMCFPMPEERIRQFAASVDRLVVVEEADTFLKDRVRAMGIPVEDIGLPRDGELSAGVIAAALGLEAPVTREPITGLPNRPPLMCPGCPHRGMFNALRKVRAVVTGDIGCYTLAALPPLSRMDTCLCMGAGVSMAHGLSLTGSVSDRPVVGVIGDSTFAHSGITALLDIAYNRGAATIVILDNRVTAMTGRQENPLTGRTLMGEATVELDLALLCQSMGIRSVRFVDPHDLSAAEEAVEAAIAEDEPSVIVSRAPCALLVRTKEQPFAVDEETCTACGVCVRLGCPAIALTPSGMAEIDATVCVGCGDCVQVCKYSAIQPAGPACDIGGGL